MEQKEAEKKNSVNQLKKAIEDRKEQKTEPKKEEKHQKEDHQKKIEELTDTLQRLQAEFDNYRKRVEKEKQEFMKYAEAEFIKNMLPFLDTFEIALKHTQDHEKFVKGIELVYAQLFSLLEKEGLRPIEALGKKCDPNVHDVMLKEKSDKNEDIIIEEFQKGYFLKDKVLRHSKVKISSKE